MSKPAFWVLGEDILREMLERAQAGENIDLIVMEVYVNSDVSEVEGGEDG